MPHKDLTTGAICYLKPDEMTLKRALVLCKQLADNVTDEDAKRDATTAATSLAHLTEFVVKQRNGKPAAAK